MFKAILKRAVIGAGIGAGAGAMVTGCDWKKGAIIGAVAGVATELVKTMAVDAIIPD